MYDINSYYMAKDVEDAIHVLKKNPQAVVISGGSDVLIKIREGRLAGCDLVSIHGLESLKGIRMEPDRSILIGSGNVFSQIVNNPLIQKHLALLACAADQVGGPQTRNIGTIGGNVCNGVTSADCGSPLCALNAVLEVEGADGKRRIPISQWYAGPGRTVLKQDEILTGIRIEEEDYQGYAGHYIKYGRRNAMEIATMGCAVWLKLSEDKKGLEDLRLAFGVAGPVPLRCGNTEEKFKGEKINSRLFEDIAEGVLEEVNPRSSWRASREFRLQLAGELVKRALKQAIVNGGGEPDA